MHTRMPRYSGMYPASSTSVLTHRRIAPSHALPPSSQRDLHLLVRLHIDLGLFPLASRHATPEQYVDLAVGQTLHLRQVEVCRY